ncbi:MAG: dTMP kinase [Spirochaetaceae bacterium]|nr:dTMP kinase [Spirochaetaceae bacterium]
MLSNDTDLFIKNFIVLEGLDGSGTTTQASRIAGLFGQAGLVYEITAEPTKRPEGVLIRKILGGEIESEPETLAYLFAADRHQHLYGHGGILEQCAKGKIVLCDRYALSSLAYQGMACGNDLPAILNAGFPAPQLTLFFRIRPETAMRRVSSRSQLEIFEKLAAQQKIALKYDEVLEAARAKGWKIVEIDAERDIQSVTDQIVAALRGIGIPLS